MEAAMKSAREESSRMADEIERLNLGLRNNTELNVRRAIEEQRLRVTQAQQLYEDVAGTDGGFVAEVRLQKEQEILKQYEAQLQKLQDQATELEGITFQREQEVKSAQEALELEKQMSDELTRRNQHASDITRELNNQVRLNQFVLQYGEDSAQVEAERNRQARANFVIEQMRAGLSADQITSQLEILRLSQESANEAERIKDAIERVQDTNLSSFNDQVRMLATLLGTSADEAARLLSNLPVGMTFGNRGALAGYTGAELLPPPRREPGQRASRVDPLEQLQQRLKLEQDLLGKTEAQRRVIQALGVDWRKYGEKTIKDLVTLVEKLDETNRKIAEQQSIADTIKDSMSDAFMSMVDGTKTVEDAFKGMARAIIKQLYDVLVVQQLVGSFNATTGVGTGITGAIMGAFTGARESGGSMMAGRPYLVGERGPELVIPGRSSTVSNADLTNKAMSGESIVINNNINVTGGTDPAAIRQEVAKLMPQITNATKTAVIDARRRGGQMKAAFG
jgi:hypothetical protein